MGREGRRAASHCRERAECGAVNSIPAHASPNPDNDAIPVDSGPGQDLPMTCAVWGPALDAAIESRCCIDAGERFSRSSNHLVNSCSERLS